MNRAEFLKTANTADGGNGLYPLSIQGLDFLQSQTQLLESLTLIGGRRYIIRMPDTRIPELIVIDGELLPLEYGKGAGIRIREVREDIVADGVTYSGARVRRTAYFVSGFVKDTPGLYPASGFQIIQSNDRLAKKLSDIVALRSEIGRRLPVVTTGSLTRTQLDNTTENCRICCRSGCVELNGAGEYSVDVYRHSDDNITQEQVLPDNTRFVRHWDARARKWTAFVRCGDSLHLDFKIVRGSTVYVRHGHIPGGLSLVLLRKKKRTPKRRTGGPQTRNSLYRGKTVVRQPKNQYVHYRGVILSTGVPGRWYVPRCIGVADSADNSLIGKELGKVCAGMIVQMNSGSYRVAGTRIMLAPSGSGHTGCAASGYARIALQIADAGRTFKSAGGEMVRLKYRMWFDRKSVAGETKTIVRRGFSVD